MPGSLQQRTELGLFRKPTYKDLWVFNIEKNGPYAFDYIQQSLETLEIKTEFSKCSTLMETE